MGDVVAANPSVIPPLIKEEDLATTVPSGQAKDVVSATPSVEAKSEDLATTVPFRQSGDVVSANPSVETMKWQVSLVNYMTNECRFEFKMAMTLKRED